MQGRARLTTIHAAKLNVSKRRIEADDDRLRWTRSVWTRYSPVETMRDLCARVQMPSAKPESGEQQRRAGIAGEKAFQPLPCCVELMLAYERQLLVV